MSATTNPLLNPWDTPYGLPPFAAVQAEHFEPAFEQAMKEHLDEIDAIGHQPQAPDFDNTAAAMDRAGRLLDRVSGLFYNLTASETSPALQAVQRRMAPRMAAHYSAVSMHKALFARLDTLHAEREAMELTAEQKRLLERVHFDFVRSGALMAAPQQQRYAQIMARLAELTTRFGQNVLADESAFQLVLRGPHDTAGLPEFVCTAAKQAALERGIDDGLLITLSRSHIVPFLTFSERRDLREHAWQAWTTRGEHPGEHDNRPVAQEILTLRNEQARLHGCASYADYALADTMAGSPANVARLTDEVWAAAKPRAVAERV